MSPTDRDVAYVEQLRPELAARLAELHAEEVAYFGPDEPELTEIVVIDLTLDVAADGVLDLVVEHDLVSPGREDERETRRLRIDREYREALDRSFQGSYAQWAARHLYFGIDCPQAIDPDEVAAASTSLPDAEALLEHVRAFVGGERIATDRIRVGRATVCLTPEQWREHVVDWEVTAQRDRGPDAMRPGHGPVGAAIELEELLGEYPAYVVWWRGALHGSSRAGLPPI
ncbi:hypothetical protein GCM10009737_05670 [Nocardioides lentus]|uniref:DUF4253 domain-containing protein n=1 Tax=Nocardioides lentus TaxID=338077 RepID=A0ABN2NZ63_9ACTN